MNGDRGYSIDMFSAFIKFKILGALLEGIFDNGLNQKDYDCENGSDSRKLKFVGILVVLALTINSF